MHRRSSLPFVAAVALAAMALHPSTAHAAPKDAAAQKLQGDAMNSDYLGTNFTGAESKLQKALKTCGETGCSPAVVAKLHRDLGVVYIGGMNKPDQGKAEFAAAQKADPAVALDKDLTTPDIQKAWDEVKKKGAKAAPADEEEEEEEEPKPKPKPKKKASSDGDLVHTPPAEQAILTPVPIFVELPDDVEAVKVQVRYKPFGTTEWKPLDLKRMGAGWGGGIPCLDIGDTTGDLSYYIQAVDAGGDVVGTAGTKNAPNKVPIRNELKGEPPHLPNRPPPAQCENASNCPPGLPGCVTSKKGKGKRGNKGWGASCDDSKECDQGLECRNGQCENADGASSGSTGDAPAKSCESEADCGGLPCNAGVCAGSAAKKVWVSLSVQQDLAVIGGNDVCDPSQRASGYSCFTSSGAQYFGQPYPGNADKIGSGIAPATTRILLGLDYFVTPNISVGARAGIALRGGPQEDAITETTYTPHGGSAFLPIHAEVRGAYWFGKDPLAVAGIHPFVFLAAGFAQVDAKVSTSVLESGYQIQSDNSLAATADTAIDPTTGQPYPVTQPLDAYKRMGKVFAGPGAGVTWSFSSRTDAIVFEAKGMVMFPTSGFVISPTLGYMRGF